MPDTVGRSELDDALAPSRRVPRWLSWTVLLAIVVCVVGLGLPTHAGHPTITQRLGLELPAGLILLVPGLLLLTDRVPSLGSGRAIRGTGAFFILIGLGLVGLGMGRITGADGWHALAAPAIVMIWLLLAREVRHPSRSQVFMRIRQERGRANLWLVYATSCFLLILLVPVLLTSVGVIG